MKLSDRPVSPGPTHPNPIRSVFTGVQHQASRWFKHISEAAEAYKQKPKRGGEPRNNDSSHQDAHDQTNSTSQPKSKTEENNDTGDTEEDRTADIDVSLSTDQPTTPEPNKPNLGKLKRKDETIRQALAEKQALVADMLNVPREDFETIADMAGEPALDKDPAELLLASVNQVNQLTRIMNEALDIGEQEVVGGGVTNSVPASRLPSVPAHKLQPITTSLIAYLTQLLIIMPEKEEEKERLRRELQVCREQLHALHEKQDFTKPSVC